MLGATKIEWMSVETLIPYAKNARTHSDEQVAQIAGSIKEFGFNNPVLIDKENSIIAGHGRLMAARKLGMDKVPVVQLDHMTEAQRKAYVLADNRIALNSGWDTGMLSLELQELKDDIDLYEEAVTIASIYCHGAVFMFYADTVPFGLYRGIENVGGEVVALLIWKKKGGYGALGASYKLNHEPCVIWKKKGDRLNFIGSTAENRIWEEDKEGVNKLHPTQKPVAIPKRAIGNHKADIVLDMFGGSGSTLIACEELGRKARVMELDPKYCDVIVQRWEEFTGKKAILSELEKE